MAPAPPTASSRPVEAPEPADVAEDLRHLRDWLSMQPHLPEVDDMSLEGFLHGCKYSLSRCKEIIDKFFTVKAAMPEFFKNRDPCRDDIRQSCKVTLVTSLPQLSPSGHRVLIHRLLDPDVNKFDFLTHCKRTFMIADFILRYEKAQGVVIVTDFKYATWSHVAKIPLLSLKKLSICMQDTYPVRVKEIHLVNAPGFVDKLMELIKPLLKKKLRERIHVHTSGMEGLYKYLPPNILPEEYGGQEKSIKELSDEAQKTLESKRDWIIAEEKMVADESKRSGKAIEYSALFGVEGSFRKLTID